MLWTALVVVAIFVVPFVLGNLIARALRLKDTAGRIGVVLLAAMLGLTPFIAQWWIGWQEQSEYAAVHAAWEKTGRERASNHKVTDSGIETLEKAIPDLRIDR